MALSFTALQKTQLQYAVDLMVKGQAYETPLDSQAIESIARAIAGINFVPPSSPTNTPATDGKIKQELEFRPFSTLLQILLFVGA